MVSRDTCYSFLRGVVTSVLRELCGTTKLLHVLIKWRLHDSSEFSRVREYHKASLTEMSQVLENVGEGFIDQG